LRFELSELAFDLSLDLLDLSFSFCEIWEFLLTFFLLDECTSNLTFELSSLGFSSLSSFLCLGLCLSGLFLSLCLAFSTFSLSLFENGLEFTLLISWDCIDNSSDELIKSRLCLLFLFAKLSLNLGLLFLCLSLELLSLSLGFLCSLLSLWLLFL
jgi:hypothetical protein